ncbi:MAG: response regulator [Synergistaceae bacterium]|nr:response regulator [Synergistaceae bacterium]
MYDIALCENSPSDAVELQNILDDYEEISHEELRVKHFITAESLMQSITSEGYRPDIIFTDINLPGISGIEAAKRLRAGNFPGNVIFITASENYALDAWELCARQYIIKPATKDKIFSALGRIFPARKFIIVRQRKAVRKIFLNEILYCETHEKYQAIITRSEEISVRITARDMRKLIAPTARVILLN